MFDNDPVALTMPGSVFAATAPSAITMMMMLVSVVMMTLMVMMPMMMMMPVMRMILLYQQTRRIKFGRFDHAIPHRFPRIIAIVIRYLPCRIAGKSYDRPGHFEFTVFITETFQLHLEETTG